jgi:hypothetical protein
MNSNAENRQSGVENLGHMGEYRPMRIRTVIGLATVLIAIAAVSSPVRAIAVCYDYVYYRLTGIDPDPKAAGKGWSGYLGRADIERYLKKKGYAPLQIPPSGSQFKRGDVIFIPTHVGFANGPDNIDHFLQLSTALTLDPKAVYDATRLPNHEVIAGLMGLDGKFARGGLYKGDTLERFLSRPYVRTSSYIVWRVGPKTSAWDGAWTWISGKTTITRSGNTLKFPMSFTAQESSEWSCSIAGSGNEADCTWTSQYHNGITGKDATRRGTGKLTLIENHIIEGKIVSGKAVITWGPDADHIVPAIWKEGYTESISMWR